MVGEVAERYRLYTKITGSQRIWLFGAQKDDLPTIWSQLIAAGQAYAKALRMAKTCVGSACVGDTSFGFGIALQNRYKGIHTPHKMKFGFRAARANATRRRAKTLALSPRKKAGTSMSTATAV